MAIEARAGAAALERSSARNAALAQHCWSRGDGPVTAEDIKRWTAMPVDQKQRESPCLQYEDARSREPPAACILLHDPGQRFDPAAVGEQLRRRCASVYEAEHGKATGAFLLDPGVLPLVLLRCGPRSGWDGGRRGGADSGACVGGCAEAWVTRALHPHVTARVIQDRLERTAFVSDGLFDAVQVERWRARVARSLQELLSSRVAARAKQPPSGTRPPAGSGDTAGRSRGWASGGSQPAALAATNPSQPMPRRGEPQEPEDPAAGRKATSGAGSSDRAEGVANRRGLLDLPESLQAQQAKWDGIDMSGLVAAADGLVRGYRPLPRDAMRQLHSIAGVLQRGRPALVKPLDIDRVPSPRWGHVSCLSQQGGLFVHGGSCTTTKDPSVRFDFGALEWETLPPDGGGGRAWHALVVHKSGQRAVRFGGMRGDGADDSAPLGELDFASKRWSTLESVPAELAPAPTYGTAVCRLGSRAAAFGGSIRESESMPRSVGVLDLEKCRWLSFEGGPTKAVPQGRRYHTLTAISESTAVLFGGQR